MPSEGASLTVSHQGLIISSQPLMCRLEDIVQLCSIADAALEQLQEAEAQPDLRQMLAYLGATILTPEEASIAQAACQ